MLVRSLALGLVTLAVCFCPNASSQQQDAKSAQTSSDTTQTNEGGTITLPAPPADLIVPKIPNPGQVEESQGSVLKTSSITSVHIKQEEGFSALPQQGDLFSFDDDRDIGQEIIQDAGSQTRRKLFGNNPPSLESGVTSAVAASSEKIGNLTSSDFLQKTIPRFVRSDLFGTLADGGSLLLDSEPTAGPELDNPNPVNFVRSALLNFQSVAGGGVSSFGDSGLTEACNRLRAVYSQTQFNLNATQQMQVQSVLTWCAQQASTGGAQPKGPTGTFDPRTSSAPAPQKSSSTTSASDCRPGAKVCH